MESGGSEALVKALAYPASRTGTAARSRSQGMAELPQICCLAGSPKAVQPVFRETAAVGHGMHQHTKRLFGIDD